MVCQPGFCLYADLFSIKNDKAVICKVHHWAYPSLTWSPIAFSISGARKKKQYEVVSDRLNLKHSPQDRLACQTVNLSCIEVWFAVWIYRSTDVVLQCGYRRTDVVLQCAFQSTDVVLQFLQENTKAKGTHVHLPTAEINPDWFCSEWLSTKNVPQVTVSM